MLPGTQTAIAQQIQEAEAEYILTLKSNHPALAQDAHRWFQENKQNIDNTSVKVTEVTCEAGHHRIEKRRWEQVPVDEVFPATRIKQWAGLKTLVIEESQRSLWNQTTCCVRFFLSSLTPDFPDFPSSIRSHWGARKSITLVS